MHLPWGEKVKLMRMNVIRFEINGMRTASLTDPHNQVERMGMRLVDALKLLHQLFQPGHVKRRIGLMPGKRLKLVNRNLYRHELGL